MRPGVTIDEVRHAIHCILQRGQNPSVHAIRRELGRGSMTTLLRLVRQLKQANEFPSVSRTSYRHTPQPNPTPPQMKTQLIPTPQPLPNEDRRALLRQLEKLTDATLLLVRHWTP